MSDERSDACVWHPLADGERVRIEIVDGRSGDSEPAASCEHDRAIEAEWARLCAENPRYFNGPILAVVGVNPGAGSVRVRRDEFKRLAVRPAVETGVAQLGVTGVLEANDAAGRPHVLLGKRSDETRVFGGMWELGPSGGVDAPPISQSTMDWTDVWRVLVNEIREEVGLPIDPDPSPPAGVVCDAEGHSVELVVRVRIARPVEELLAAIDDESGTNRWEYDAIRWVPVDSLEAFARAEPLIAATRAIWRGLFRGE